MLRDEPREAPLVNLLVPIALVDGGGARIVARRQVAEGRGEARELERARVARRGVHGEPEDAGILVRIDRKAMLVVADRELAVVGGAFEPQLAAREDEP